MTIEKAYGTIRDKEKKVLSGLGELEFCWTFSISQTIDGNKAAVDHCKIQHRTINTADIQIIRLLLFPNNFFYLKIFFD